MEKVRQINRGCIRQKGVFRDWGSMATYILPKNDHQNDKQLGWALWHLVFNVSTDVRNSHKDSVRITSVEDNSKQ